MSTNGARASSVASSSEASLVGASGYKFKKDGKKATKVKLKIAPAMRRQDSDLNGSKIDEESSRSASPIVPEFGDDVMANFPSGKQREEKMETVICKHCKRPVLKLTSKEHISGCLKSKQEKARKKKEAREAAARAKEKAENKDEDEDDEDDDKGGSKGTGARKSAAKSAGADDGTKKGKKRKAEVEDEKDKEPKKKKTKKEEQKPKVAKPKGPVDVERQCGVTLPNGAQCARSLTCKSHSMGAKRAVPGRSLPYDMLLQAYQKKNQARQQKAAIDANAPMLLDDDIDGPLAAQIDSDEERDAVMTAISRSLARPQPVVTKTLFSTRRKYQLVRMKERLSNALSGNRGGGLFSVPPDSARTPYPGATVNDSFAMPSAVDSSIPATGGMAQPSMKGAARKSSVGVT